MALRIGISGSGYIATGAIRLLSRRSDLCVTRVLSRSARRDGDPFPYRDLLTHEINVLIAESDLVLECSGHVADAYDVVVAAVDAGRPVITMNAEFQITLGYLFAGKGWISESQGDQPGSIALLAEEAASMGFKPLVYGSQKGFLAHNPSLESMTYWARKQGIRLASVVSFTDGTKVEIEQALVANALGARIPDKGMLGVRAESVRSGAFELVRHAEQLGAPIADFVLVSGGRGEVFIVATHDAQEGDALNYYKLGDWPYYLIERPFHLGYFEIPATVQRYVQGLPPLLAPVPAPRYSVAAVAKRDLYAGEEIKRGIGSFEVRGRAVSMAQAPDHLPIGLMEACTIAKPVQAGQILTLDDVLLSRPRAVAAWRAVQANISPNK